MRVTEERRERRRAASRFGRRAEWLAAVWLMLKGYRILARDVRLAVGEIDIIARRGGVLAIIEVKARRGKGAAQALSLRQRRRIARAADCYLAGQPALSALAVRFDLIIVGHWRLPKHLEGAWSANI